MQQGGHGTMRGSLAEQADREGAPGHRRRRCRVAAVPRRRRQAQPQRTAALGRPAACCTDLTSLPQHPGIQGGLLEFQVRDQHKVVCTRLGAC